MKLLFYPKKWFLYRALRDAYRVWELSHGARDASAVFRVLDVGAASGSSVIDLSRMLGPRAVVEGIDVQAHMIAVGQKALADAALPGQATLALYDGSRFPSADAAYDAVYTSDVLGHVPDARVFVREIARVLAPGGTLAMFTESALGRHAFFRKYLWYRGCNTDPHARFHISLHTKRELMDMFRNVGLDVLDMRTLFWASFLVHPDEAYEALARESRFPILRFFNRTLVQVKKALHPVSSALCELYGLGESYLVGSSVEAQGYVVIGRKR
jgi:SAM-dependent methyltransferase